MWFRQTADRGVGSAAFRRNQEDPLRETIPTGDKMRLPGMARESTVEPEKPSLPDSVAQRAASLLQDGSSQDASRTHDRFKSSNAAPAATRPPLPLSSSQKLTPPEADIQEELSERPAELLPLPSKALSDRPPSPTKGLGGFVQSAMMKRSDSVNKRWSTQAAPGLKRGDSIAGHRGTLGNFAPVPLTRGASPPRETNLSLGPPSSPSTHSRPSSSHNTNTASQKPFVPLQRDTFEPVNGAASLKLDLNAIGVDEKTKRGTELSLQVGGDGSGLTKSPEERPSSPIKTMDPKRWSPTKASWLESALSKPESPKITSSKVEQPTWRSDLQKSKQSKADTSGARSPTSSFEVITQPGLMRSPPPGGHSRPLSIGGLPEGFSSGQVKKTPVVRQKSSSIQDDPFRQSENQNDTSVIGPPNAVITPEAGAESKFSTKQMTVPDLPITQTDIETNKNALPDSMSKQKPPALKPKPQTPPKTDFRANLKSRQKQLQDSASAEPEFKNVFGNLRRAETKNYVAPDLLKTNILTGKAALNLTGGPQKTKRTDEFKESLVSQKEAMKAGGGSITKKSETTKGSSEGAPKPAAAIPEALAKRNQLSKALGVAAGQRDTKSSVQVSISSKPPAKPPLDLPQRAPMSTESTTVESLKTSHQSDLSKAAMDAATLTSSDGQRPVTDTQSANFEPTDKPGSGKLANRMNPALASILMRGPPSNTSSRNHSTEDLSTSISNSARPSAGASQDPGEGQLTHVTKGRAKGPKRRLPKTEVESKEADKAKPVVAVKSPKVRKVSSPRPQSVGLDSATSTSSTALNSTSSPLPNRPLATLINQKDKIQPSISKPLPKSDVKPAEEPETTNRPKPAIAAKSPDLRMVSSPRPQLTVLEDTVSATASDARRPTSPLATRTSSPGKRAVEREQMQNSVPIEKDIKGDQIRDEAKINLASKSQSQMPQKATMGAAGRLNGLGLELGNSERTQTKVSKPQPTPPEDEAFVKRNAITESTTRQGRASPEAEERLSAAAAGPTASRVLEEFFDEHPKAAEKADIDTQAAVSSHAGTAEKTKTLRMQIWEVNGDGKKQDMPPQQEHILFEECMYLCIHSLENSKGSKGTEAFLWCGDNVGEAAVEDAQLFCRKVARENGAKLELLKQGKETPSLIQALGGIIITRRSKSSALYMLCGRRHLGHVSFDEVDIDANSLCSGFPYLISARFGRLYLWKGKGSGADEIGCARLIGMDLGLTGEIEEVNEDDEPLTFWEAALGTNSHPARSKWSDHWTLRGTPDHYSCRLFRIELDNPRPVASFWSRRGSSPAKATKTGLVQEMVPFCQKDLEASHIFVLDAYFEIYVFVGDQARSKSAEFVTALFFAQEFSILAASLQDRPFVPPCHVTWGAPPDFRSVFRKWSGPGGRPTTIPLNAAIEALA